MKKTSAAGGQVSRKRLAIGGLVTSYCTMVIGLVIGILTLLIGARAWVVGSERASALITIRDQGSEISTACEGFANANGSRYPAALAELATSGFLTAAELAALQKLELPNGSVHEFQYRGGGTLISDSGEKLILHSLQPLPGNYQDDGKVMYAIIRKSGAMEVIPTEEL